MCLIKDTVYAVTVSTINAWRPESIVWRTFKVVHIATRDSDIHYRINLPICRKNTAMVSSLRVPLAENTQTN